MAFATKIFFYFGWAHTLGLFCTNNLSLLESLTTLKIESTEKLENKKSPFNFKETTVRDVVFTN
jgi:hypothetical protein